jgi:hypothetical protein
MRMNKLVGRSDKYEIAAAELMFVGATGRWGSSSTKTILRLLAQEIDVKPLTLSVHRRLEEIRFVLTQFRIRRF